MGKKVERFILRNSIILRPLLTAKERAEIQDGQVITGRCEG